MCARVVLAGLAAAGCTTTAALDPAELTRLDGFDVRQPARAQLPLRTLTGPATFDRSTRLQLDLPTDRVDERFVSIRVRDGKFEGETVAGERIGGQLAEVRAAHVTTISTTPSVIVVAGTVLVLAALGIFLATQPLSAMTPGRPLRVGGKPVSAPVVPGEGWSGEGAMPDVSALSPAARAALAKLWTESAQAEHASVPAFSRLSLALMAVGAPARLVEAAHRAALDEIEHARRAFALASCYGGAPVAPGELAELHFAPDGIAAGLQELAQESLLDGCLNEGLAAAIAAEASGRAGDPAARAVLAAVACDETAHAELGWEIVAWCCMQSGVEMHRALRQALRAAPTPTPWWDVPAQLLPELGAHGWPGSDAWERLAAQTRDQVATRLEQLAFQHDRPEADGDGPSGDGSDHG
jgi:hypothetical protein